MPLVSGPHLLSSMADTSVARWSERSPQRIRLPVQKHFFNFQIEKIQAIEGFSIRIININRAGITKMVNTVDTASPPRTTLPSPR